jgi:hypothetical protein
MAEVLLGGILGDGSISDPDAPLTSGAASFAPYQGYSWAVLLLRVVSPTLGP